MGSLSVRKANPNDYADIVAVYSSALETMKAMPSEQERESFLSRLNKEIEEGHGLVLRSGSRLIGFALYGHDLEGTLYPQTRSYAKSSALLEEMDCFDGEVYVLYGLYINGAYQRHGYGQQLLKAVIGLKPKTHWVSFSTARNAAMDALLLDAGFIALPRAPVMESPTPKTLYGKTYRSSGLCREARW